MCVTVQIFLDPAVNLTFVLLVQVSFSVADVDGGEMSKPVEQTLTRPDLTGSLEQRQCHVRLSQCVNKAGNCPKDLLRA